MSRRGASRTKRLVPQDLVYEAWALGLDSIGKRKS